MPYAACSSDAPVGFKEQSPRQWTVRNDELRDEVGEIVGAAMECPTL